MRTPPTGTNWPRRIVMLFVLVLAGLLLWLFARAVLPRWWAQRVADVVAGRMTTGALFGLFVGGVFTAVPLAVLAASIRWRSPRRSWIGWGAWALVAALLALPNWMTLGIVTGSGDAAHAGERILDVDGPGFRMWSLIGAIVGAVAVAFVLVLARSRRVNRDRARAARREVDELRRRDG